MATQDVVSQGIVSSSTTEHLITFRRQNIVLGPDFHFQLIDLSDTQNFPHHDDDQVKLSSVQLFLSKSRQSVPVLSEIGYIRSTTTTTSDVQWLHELPLVRSSEKETLFQFVYPNTLLLKNVNLAGNTESDGTIETLNVVSSENFFRQNVLWSTGDLVLRVRKTSGNASTNVDIFVAVTYASR